VSSDEEGSSNAVAESSGEEDSTRVHKASAGGAVAMNMDRTTSTVLLSAKLATTSAKAAAARGTYYERCCRNTASGQVAVGRPNNQGSTNQQQQNRAGQQNNGRQNAYDCNLNSQSTDHVQEQEEQQLLYGDYLDGEEEGHALTDEELRDLENSIMNEDGPQVSLKRKKFLEYLQKLGRPRAWFENVSIRGVPIKVKIDSGSSVNTLPWNVFVRLGISKDQIQPTIPPHARILFSTCDCPGGHRSGYSTTQGANDYGSIHGPSLSWNSVTRSRRCSGIGSLENREKLAYTVRA
jgi:hypothetical protein